MAESASKKRKPLNRLTSFALGTAFAVGDVIDESVTAAANVTKGALQVADAVTAPVRKPLDKLGVTEMKGSWFIWDRFQAHEDWCEWRAPFWHGGRVMDPDSHRVRVCSFR